MFNVRSHFSKKLTRSHLQAELGKCAWCTLVLYDNRVRQYWFTNDAKKLGDPYPILA